MAHRNRRRNDEAPGPSGFLVVDKPAGWTSHDVVDAARGWFGTRRVGHLGTLDPLATGVLPLAIRAATKLVPYVQDRDKGYAGAIRLGTVTDTLDAEGRVLHTHSGPWPNEASVEKAMQTLVGGPRHRCRRCQRGEEGRCAAHKLCSRGPRGRARSPSGLYVGRFELRKYDPPRLEIEVECSGGTYVRVLAADLGERLGCGAHTRGSAPDAQRAVHASTRRCLRRRCAWRRVGRARAAAGVPARSARSPALRVTPQEVQAVAQGSEIPPTPALVAGNSDGGARRRRAGHRDPQLRPGRRLRPLRVLEPFAGRR